MDRGLAEQATAQAVGREGDLTLFDALDSLDAIMFGETLSQHREAGLQQRASREILSDQLTKEGGGFVGDTLAKEETIFRVEQGVGIGLVEPA